MTEKTKTPRLYPLLVAFIELVLSRRWLFLGGVAIISVLSMLALTQVILSTSLEGLFFGPEHQAYKQYKMRRAQFGGDEAILFAIEHDRPLGVDNLNKLSKVHDELLKIKNVKRVSSIANVKRVRSVSGTIETVFFAEQLRADPSKEKKFLALMRDDPVLKGLFLAPNAGHFTIMIELDPGKQRTAEQGPGLLKSITKVLVDGGYPKQSLHQAGFVATMAEIVRQSQLNLFRLLPLVLLSLLIAVYLMFGKWWPVWVTSISAMIAVLWSLAFGVMRDPHFSIMMTLVPCLILIISFSDVVHMCSTYFLELQSGKDKRAAIIEACADVGTACFLTSLTTCVGFMSMMFVPSPVFQRLGLTAGVGVGIAYLLAMIIVPLALDTLPEPKNGWKEGRLSFIQASMDNLLTGLAGWTSRKPWPIIFVFFVFFAVCAWGTTQIYFETELNQRLREDNMVRVDERFFKKHFGATATMDIYIETPNENGLLEPRLFESMVKFEREVEARQDVDQVVSIFDLLETTHKAIVGKDGMAFLPTTGPRLAQTMELLQMQGIDALSPMVDFSRKNTRLTVYTNQGGIRGQYNQSIELTRMARRIFGKDAKVKVEVLGLGGLLGSWVDEIVSGQKRGVLVSMAIICLILIFGFGSIRMGVVSMLPNILPLLAVGGYCGIFWTQVDSDTLIVAMIAIGIGVDDTIHFISRYKLERMMGADQQVGLHNTFQFSGRGIFMTTFVFTLGFVPFVLSEYTTIATIGLLLPFAFIVAVLADLFWVPALIRVGWLDVPASQGAKSTHANESK